MERTCMRFLINWLNTDDRLPLVIRGARQVGKTWLVRHLAETQGLRLIEINFDEHKELAYSFVSNNPERILETLAGDLGIEPIDPKMSLLFLDEIQAVPELYAKLRWFAEKMPELAVIAAGSLFEFIFKKHTEEISMPVGRVEFMYLEPFSFEEFLLAQKKALLVRSIHKFSWREGISPVSHKELLRLFKEYIIIGGMPAAVKKWVESKNFFEVSKKHHNILATFKGDFHKYAGRIDPDLIEQTMEQVPLELSKKFVYSKVTREVQVPTIKKAFKLLCKARICHRVISTAANGVPLRDNKNEKFIKALLVDVGLCSALLNLSLESIRSVEELTLINSGGIAEQVVGQLLRTLCPLFMNPELYYWLRHVGTSDAEVDYVVQHGSHVVPIEVKAGETGGLKSLHLFMHLKKLPLAARVYSGFPLKTEVNTKIHDGTPVSYELRSIPFYLVSELHRLLD